ncbi:helix-turn-helix domain-containing protein [Rhodococcus sp. NPDC057135]|uniref:helix-turn-helix domain-containing protein n=1 Tax=Rhodococcus sp. NPDC057135 TaxID=3346028 RepID=UPI00363CF117
MFVSSRLVAARKRRGVTITALSVDSGISTKSISDYENGKKSPTTDTVKILASALRVRPDYFSRPTLNEVPVDAVSFRAPTKMTARSRDMAISISSHAIELRKWIEARYRTPQVNVPTLDRYLGVAGAASAAEVVRAKWGLGVAPLGNIVHLLELHGVAVFTVRGKEGAFDAFSFREGDQQPYILLSPYKSPERGRFDAAHELGHLVLHGGPVCATGVAAEREADAFASSFLMPESDVRAVVRPNLSVPEILKIKKRWNVSAMATAYRLHDLGLLTDWLYHTTCVNLSRMGYRSGEPDGMRERESSSLLLQVMADIRSSRRGFVELCEDLGVEPHDVNDLVFNLAPISVQGDAQTTPGAKPALRLVDS